ncbi:hypothetical protein RchiOBHm_Chr3g0479781 [Rosa chinensis]|uniref:Uncharacterized protein n=1 Tax=Rosa chinensis TaxID=74649 RepID=A0A2P6RDJ0_ROSCH|nr:hypothetical protein RchiOBHm_Chr3g0479781 [Rosa chinensis]
MHLEACDTYDLIKHARINDLLGLRLAWVSSMATTCAWATPRMLAQRLHTQPHPTCSNNPTCSIMSNMFYLSPKFTNASYDVTGTTPTNLYGHPLHLPLSIVRVIWP